MTKAEIIGVGEELILGTTVDTNSAWLAGQLASLGIVAGRHVTVGDDEKSIRAAIVEAAQRSTLVLITGGLGPTVDDRTRAALAKAIDKPLEFHAESWKHIESFFRRLGRTPTESNRLQAYVPRGCRPIPNTCGTAPGIEAMLGKARLFVMPGVPSEMRTMFTLEILPTLRGTVKERTTLIRILRCFGMDEAAIGESIADFMSAGRNPSVGTQAAEGVVSIRLAATAESGKEAERLIAEDAAAIRGRLGDTVLGKDDDTLASVVGARLRERRLTVATAESCTGGLLAKQLTDVPGSSAYFLGGFVTYANRLKCELLGVPARALETHGAVSGETASAMAEACRRITEADFALAITGITGPGGGSREKPVGLVYVALAGADGTTDCEYHFPAESGREGIRDRSCKAALDLLCRRLSANG